MFLKPQDIVFIIVLVLLLLRKDARLFIAAGLVSLAISMPLFAKWIFFTAERLVLYGFIFLVLSILLSLIQMKHNK